MHLLHSRQKLFGTDGIRGKANQFPMSADMILRVGQAIGIYFRRNYSHPRVLIGKDTRKSGYMVEQALSSGICSVGVDTSFLGPLPTPGIAYMTRGMRASAGIVISASHNPYYDNGIKIFSANGYKLPDEVEAELEALVYSDTLNSDLPFGKGLGESTRIDDAVGQYAVFLKEQFPKNLSLEGMRIVIDCANGAAYKVAPKVFQELGAEIFLIGGTPDGTNINEQCGALHPERLAEHVKLYKADLGIAVDGDADRLIVVDERGEILDGDEILAICGSYYLKKGRLKKNILVATIMSNMGLDACIKAHGGTVLRTQVGDRYVVEKMRAGDYNLGGEQSGHLIFRDSSTTGDGLLGALCLLEIIVEQGIGLNELKRCMSRFPQLSKNMDIPQKVPLSEMPKFQKKLDLAQAKLSESGGRVLFRYSGTELKARLMLEGQDRDVLEALMEELSDDAVRSIRDYLHLPPEE